MASVGSAYTLMTFLTSIMIGLCMGSGTVFSVCFGKKDRQKMKNSIVMSFLFILAVTIIINIVVFIGIDLILHMMHVPNNIYEMMREYIVIIFGGIFFFFYIIILHFYCVR